MCSEPLNLSPTLFLSKTFRFETTDPPRYRMVRKAGPFTMSFISDYSVFERPHRTVNRVLESPLGGTFYSTFEPVAGGTRLSFRWELEPQNPLVGRLLPVLRPLLAWSLQRDLNTLAKAAKNYQTIKDALQAPEEPYLKAPVEAEAAQRPTPPEVEEQPSPPEVDEQPPPEAEAPPRWRDSESEEA
jgi:hypothetical protein